MNTSKDKVVPLNLGFEPAADVSGARLIQDEYRTFLTFNVAGGAGTAVIEFDACFVTKFGYPNDESLSGHPLARRGLGNYACYEVLCPTWADELEEQNQVSFPDSSDFDLRHFVFTFHDSTFECLARGLKARMDTRSHQKIIRA